MGKMTFVISKENEDLLRKYIAKHFPIKNYGKLSEVVNVALEFYLKAYP